jgi:hypothetical protein
MAGGGGPDLRPGEEKLPAAQAGACHASNAPGDTGRSYHRLAETGFLWTVEHGFHRAGSTNRPSRRGSARTPHLGHGSAVLMPARSSGMVESVLSLCTSSRSAANSAHAASRARRQTSGATLPTTYACDGSRKNTSTMDSERGAHLSIAASLRLKVIEARCGCSVLSRGDGEDASRRTRMEPRSRIRRPVRIAH